MPTHLRLPSLACSFAGVALFAVMPLRLPLRLEDPTLTAYALALCICAGCAAAALRGRLGRHVAAATVVGVALASIAIGQGLAWAGDCAAILAGTALAGAAVGLLFSMGDKVVIAPALFLGPAVAATAEHLAGDVLLGTAIAAAAMGCWLLGFTGGR